MPLVTVRAMDSNIHTRFQFSDQAKGYLQPFIKNNLLKKALPAPDFKSSSGNAVSTRDVNQLDFFTVFPNLPTEMRIKIWRSTFNPRHLKLDLSHHFSESSVSPNDVAMKEDPQDPPATLFVNRESREQTLKYYFIVWRTDAVLPTKPYTEKPFCIYPAIDTVYIFSEWAQADIEDFMLLCTWFRHLFSSLPKGIRSFHTIEYLDDRWASQQSPNLAPAPTSPHAWTVLLPNIVRAFKGMKDLRVSIGSTLDGFTYHRGFRKWLHSTQGRATSREIVKHWLSAKFAEEDIPTVTVRSFKAPARDWLEEI